MRCSRWSKRTKTSRTWQAYSRGDQTSGLGRTATSPRFSTWSQLAALARMRPGISSYEIEETSRPHSLQADVMTQVQSLVSGSISDNAEWEELGSGRADLDLGAHLRTDTAVEARDPAAVVELLLVEGFLPVGPEPLLIQAAVEVVPGQDL